MSRIRSVIKLCLSLISVVFRYNRRSKVLYLHDIHSSTQYAIEDRSMPITEFLELLEAIKNIGFTIVPEITERKNQVRLCFDDGYRGIWDCKDPLIERGIFPTIFIATSLIGTPNYLSSDEIKHLSDIGFHIQSHAFSHKPLTSFGDDDLDMELHVSKAELEKITSKVVDELCLPLGYFSNSVLSKSRKLYSRVFLSLPGSYWDDYERGLIRRLLCQDTTPLEVRLSLLGGQEIMYWRLRKQHFKNA